MTDHEQKSNPDYFPTPRRLVQKMLAPYEYGAKKIHQRSILEPSAGGGAIVDYIHDASRVYGQRVVPKVYCIESDPELKFQLQGKGYRVISDDFLSYSGDYQFDLIAMNPPFSEGEHHLLHAWDILPSGDIVCLLNEQTILNPHTRARQLLGKIIADHGGTVEHIGSAFAQSDRPTNVRVSLVRLTKPAPDNSRFNFDFGKFKSADSPDWSEEMAGNQLMVHNATESFLRCYEMTKQAYVAYLKSREALSYFGADLFARSNEKIDAVAAKCYEGKNPAGSYNTFLDEIKSAAWTTVINKMNIDKLFTEGVRKKFSDFKNAQLSAELTIGNIRQLVLFLVENRVNILEDAIVDVFDVFTRYHKENRVHVEGWKTNKGWKVGKKVILPNYLMTDHSYRAFYTLSYYDKKSNELADVDRVMCYLTGKDYDTVNKLSSVIPTIRVGDTSLHTSEFFLVRCFKKGTIHITFREESLWQEFNLRSVKQRNALGWPD